jgi:DNA-binding NtrC family response regulator
VATRAASPDITGAHPSGAVPPNTLRAEERARIRVAVIDDERSLAESCATVLRLEGYDVTVYDRPQEALDALSHRPFDVVLTDLYLPQVDGLSLLRAALTTNPACLVVVMTGQPSVDSSFEALRQGAWDYLPKPFSAAHLQILVSRAAQAIAVARETEALGAADAKAGEGRMALLGSSPQFRSALEMARKVAPTDASVFITGESGSGKELVAQFIHRHSRRASRPFVAINCAAIPETLLESEMFGHRKGSFTGAVRDKPGLLETADGGTFFLDELGEMPKAIQAKLLRVIQDGVVRRIGSETPDAVVNVRFISATNRDPEVATASGDLREDLFYRLRVVPIHLPPLRERVEDIPVLADYFLTTAWARHHPGGTKRPELTESALHTLCERPWRGNVRELQNVIEHVAVLADAGARLEADDLRLSPAGDVPANANPASLLGTLKEETYHQARDRVITQFETQYFTWLINRAGGNMSLAARLAGVDRTTLYRLMGRHHLHRNQKSGWVVDSSPEPTPVPEQQLPATEVNA